MTKSLTWSNMTGTVRPPEGESMLYCLYDKNLDRLEEAYAGFPMVANTPGKLLDALAEKGNCPLGLHRNSDTGEEYIVISGRSGENISSYTLLVRPYPVADYLAAVERQEALDRAA